MQSTEGECNFEFHFFFDFKMISLIIIWLQCIGWFIYRPCIIACILICLCENCTGKKVFSNFHHSIIWKNNMLESESEWKRSWSNQMVQDFWMKFSFWNDFHVATIGLELISLSVFSLNQSICREKSEAYGTILWHIAIVHIDFGIPGSIWVLITKW